LGNIANFHFSRRKLEDGENEEPVITNMKRAKLASLAGIDVEVKLSQHVPKDTTSPYGLTLQEK